MAAINKYEGCLASITLRRGGNANKHKLDGKPPSRGHQRKRGGAIRRGRGRRAEQSKHVFFFFARDAGKGENSDIKRDSHTSKHHQHRRSLPADEDSAINQDGEAR